MTDDKELIARLRAYREHDEGSGGMASFEVEECIEAADRIEALTKERDEADDLAKAAFADGASNNIRLAETAHRIKALTKERDAYAHKLMQANNTYTEMHLEIERLSDKLAKAVEALEFYAWENEIRLPSDGPWGAGSTDFGKVARATLAEIKGESHE